MVSVSPGVTVLSAEAMLSPGWMSRSPLVGVGVAHGTQACTTTPIITAAIAPPKIPPISPKIIFFIDCNLRLEFPPADSFAQLQADLKCFEELVDRYALNVALTVLEPLVEVEPVILDCFLGSNNGLLAEGISLLLFFVFLLVHIVCKKLRRS